MKGKKRQLLKYVAAGLITATTIMSSCPINVLATETREKLTKDEILWQTSFKDESGFLESTIDQTKGSKNVTGYVAPERVKGDVTKEVVKSSIKGSSDFNSSETKGKLFDGDTGSKFLSNDNVPSKENPIYVEFAFDEAKILDRYALVSANDSPERDPKAWVFSGSLDGQTWFEIDSQVEQTFSQRFETKEIAIKNPTAYKYYKIEISENLGNDKLTQFADLLLGTGQEQQVTREQTMVTKLSEGPSEAWNQLANAGWDDDSALEISGTHVGVDDAHSWNTLYQDLNITIDANTTISYLMFPGLINGQYDYNWTQMNMAVDLKFTDGTYLSDYDIDDVNGSALTPQGQGDSRTLVTNQWNRITARLGEYPSLRGKVISDVLVAYDNKDNKADNDVDFKNYLDDIKIYREALQEYDNNNLAEYVNILRGSNDSPGFSRGLTAPLVTMPHGFNFWAPVTNSGDNKLYTYQQNGETGTLKHISVSHEPSYWVGDRGTWEFMVNTSIDPNGTTSIGANERAAKFSHENEVAKAHYYGVDFTEGNASGSKLELSPTTHGAATKFTFNKEAKYHNVILDIVRGGNKNVTLNADKKSFSAKMTPDNANGMKTMYIYGEFDTAWSSERYGNSANNSAILNFGDASSVEMKVATSFISPEQAKKNLTLELANKDFDKVYNEAREQWNDALDVITVKGATHEQKVTLYSNLYRMFSYPNLLSENTGTNEKPLWQYKSTVSNDVKEGQLYYNNGFWDTYHTTWAGYQLLTPSKYEEMLDGLVEHYNDGQWVPRWVAPGGTNSMVGTSSDVIFGDAAAKGANFDLETAYQSALKNASVVNTENLTKGGRAELNTSIFRGYTSNSTGEGFSWSMEGYINDYGISQMAERLAKEAREAGDETKAKTYEDEAAYYRNRALNYVQLFDGSGKEATDKWFKGKNKNGSWSQGDNFDPTFWGNDYTETDAYNMTVTVPQDGNGLANLYGGSEALGQRMDSIFTTKGTFNGYNAVNGVGGIHEQKESRDVKLGQYGHSNQPSHGIIYMYNYAKQPWKTQALARDVLRRCYIGADFGQGYIGDEDNGEMSGWQVLSSLGFFPVNMGSGEFAIGSPLYDEATIHLENGKDLTIKANNNSDENVYIQSMSVNGKAHNTSFISAKTLSDGGEIIFNMGAAPNKNWGNEQSGTSLTQGDEIPNPQEDLTVSSLDVDNNLVLNPNKDTVASKGVEEITNLFDNDSNNAATFSDDTSVYYSFVRPVKVNMLTLTSTKDKQDQAPNSFTLFGSSDGKKWVELTNQKDVDFQWGRYTRPFSVENKDAGYQYYKLDLKGGTTLSEIELLGQSDDYSAINKDLLSKIIEGAKAIDQSKMSDGVKKLLNDGIDAAQEVIDNDQAAKEDIINQYNALQSIIRRVENIRSGLTKIEAESFDSSHTEIKNDGQNIGGVKKDTWVGYKDVEFEAAPNKLEVKYSVQDSDGCQKGKIEVRLDSRQGEPLFTVDTTKTGGWDKYVTTMVDIPKEVQDKFIGLHDLYFSFVGNDPIDEKQAYVANVDYFDFNKVLTQKVTANGQGTIITDKFDVNYGADFEFEVSPKDGYKAVSVTVDGEILDSYVPGTNKIKLNNVKADHDIVVTFKEDEDFNLAVKDLADGIKLELLDVDNNSISKAKAGDIVQLKISDLGGHKLKAVKVNGEVLVLSQVEQIYLGSFTMPYQDVEVEVILVETNKHCLEITVEEARKITDEELSQVVDRVVKEFKAALAQGEALLKDSKATQQQVDDAVARIAKVMQYLSFTKGDKKDLQELVNKINKLNKEDYLDNTWQAMLPALNTANSVLSDNDAMKEEVTNAMDNLLRAFLQLRLKPNKDLLQDLINKAESLDKDKYTDKSWQAFQNTLNEAKAVYNNNQATVEEVSASEVALNQAMASLVALGLNDSKTDNKVTSTTKTGDAASILYSVAGLAFASVLYNEIRKRKK